MDDQATDEVEVGFKAMLFNELRVHPSGRMSMRYGIAQHCGGTYGSDFNLVSLKVILCQGRQQEDDLSFDDGMYVRVGGVVHGGSPGPGRSLYRASTWTTTSRSRF